MIQSYTLSPNVIADVVSGKICGLYIVFRDGCASARTIRYPATNGGPQVLVDIDANGYPFAIQMLCEPEVPLDCFDNVKPFMESST